LKCIIPNKVCGHLTREHHHRDRVHISRCDAADSIRSTRSGGHQAYPWFAGRSGIAVRGMDGALLMTYQNVADVRLDELIVYVDDGTARETEDNFHFLILQYLH